MSRTKKLGYTWYPQNWRSSDRVFELSLAERGLYREIIDMAYMEGNKVSFSPNNWARRFASSVEEIESILSKLNSVVNSKGEPLIVVKNGIISVPSCESRLKLINVNRENGMKGGAPKGSKTNKNTPTNNPTNNPDNNPDNNPIDNRNETQPKRQREREREREREIERESEYTATAKAVFTPTQIDSFKKFNLWLKENAPRILQMKKPFTIEQYLKVVKLIPKERFTNLLLAMENRNDLLKKNQSAYLTILNWYRIEHNSNSNIKPNNNESAQFSQDPEIARGLQEDRNKLNRKTTSTSN